MIEYTVVFQNGIEYALMAEDVAEVEDILLQQGFSSRDVAQAQIFEVA